MSLKGNEVSHGGVEKNYSAYGKKSIPVSNLLKKKTVVGLSERTSKS